MRGRTGARGSEPQLAGIRLAYATNSRAVFGGSAGWLTSRKGALTTCATGAKSLTGSKGTFWSSGLMLMGPLEAASTV
jgi:hypothetical protein